MTPAKPDCSQRFIYVAWGIVALTAFLGWVQGHMVLIYAGMIAIFWLEDVLGLTAVVLMPARKAMEKGEYERALFWVNLAIHTTRYHVRSRLLRAEIHQRQELYELALMDYNCAYAQARDTDKIWVLQRRGYCRHQMGDLAEALDDYNQVLHFDPRDRFARLNRARVYMHRKAFDKTLADLDFLLQRNQQDWPAIFWKGLAYGTQGKQAEAIAQWTPYIQQHPHHVEAMMWRGIAYQESGYYLAALADFEQALAQDAGNPVARLHLGQLFSALEQDEKALALFTGLIEQEPDHYVARLERIAIYNRQKKLDLALAELQKAYEILQQDNWYELQLAQLYEAHTKYEQAIAYYKRFKSQSEYYATATIGLARCYQKQKAYETALAYLDQYSERHPNDAGCWYIRAINHMYLGNETRAQQDLQQAMALAQAQAISPSTHEMARFNQALYAVCFENANKGLKDYEERIAGTTNIQNLLEAQGNVQEWQEFMPANKTLQTVSALLDTRLQTLKNSTQHTLQTT